MRCNSKNYKRINILEVACRQYKDTTLFSPYFSNSEINKAITRENNYLAYICFVLLFLSLALVDMNPCNI